ncbi:phage integrase family protein [Francisella philomiragia]|uniref:tyrosine-type recombinase/integrase n=1 Tax=Francisella philomiragia TaxID=28110 RepID=UPI0005A568BC|nr:site-specific integrase [Francisella philomiragia]AJI57474.1 phage integrase family protein [Francisella philomiragia]
MAKNLTASKLQSLKATGKDYRLNDGNGLYIKVSKAGSKSWQFRYKGKWLGIGSYPAISLKQARDEAFKYNQILASGKDPKLEKEKTEYINEGIFKEVAKNALESKHPSKPNGWKSDGMYKRNVSICNRFLIPSLKTYNIREIVPRQLAKILEKETPANQKKIKTILNLIWSYAIGKGIADFNIVRDIQIDTVKTDGFEFVDPIEDKYNFSQLVNDIDKYKGQYNTKMALKLATLVGLRPNNIVTMKWEDIQETNIDGKKIPFVFISADDMKMSRDFRQPLSKQAIEIIEQMRAYNGGCKYVFYSTSSKSKHIAIESLGKALRDTLGYNGTDKPKQHTHGFRKSVRTYISSIRSKYNWCSDSIRMILSHSKENAIDNIYDKNDFLLERSQMLQLWADYVDEVKANSNIINMEVS